MSTKEEIDKIIEEDYKGYRPSFYRRIGILHSLSRKIITDEKFLDFLKECRRKNPKPPEYKVPDEILKQLINKK